MMQTGIQSILDTLVERHRLLAECGPSIADAFLLLTKTFRSGGRLLICGNGGSAADSEHIAGELLKSFKVARPLPDDMKNRLTSMDSEGKNMAEKLEMGLPALSLVNSLSLGTAFANDVDASLVFAQQVLVLGRPGDGLLGISTSGNARNVLQAFRVARAFGLATIGLTGGSGGQFPSLCDVLIRVPETSTDRIQELHVPIYHALCAMLETEFFIPSRAQ